MKMLIPAWTVVILLGSLSPLLGADIQVKGQHVTVQVQHYPLQEVLQHISQQAQIDIVSVNPTKRVSTVISASFQNLSLDKALVRLLGSWNYGVTHNPHTGQIRTLFLVSERGWDTETRRPHSSAQDQTVTPTPSHKGSTSHNLSHAPTGESPKGSAWPMASNDRRPTLIDDEPPQDMEEVLASVPREVRSFIQRILRDTNS